MSAKKSTGINLIPLDAHRPLISLVSAFLDRPIPLGALKPLPSHGSAILDRSIPVEAYRPLLSHGSARCFEDQGLIASDMCRAIN